MMYRFSKQIWTTIQKKEAQIKSSLTVSSVNMEQIFDILKTVSSMILCDTY
jgi:hypothetical protein